MQRMVHTLLPHFGGDGQKEAYLVEVDKNRIASHKDVLIKKCYLILRPIQNL